MIRSSKHSLGATNTGKIHQLSAFLAEYRIALGQCVDYVWNLQTDTFNVAKDLLDLPPYLDYKQVEYKGKLSARALCSAFEQAIDIVRGTVQKRKQLLYVLDKLQAAGKDTVYINKQLEKYTLVKPIISDKIPAQLSNKCIDIQSRNNHFDLFVRLKSTGFEHIKLPISHTKSFSKRKDWKTMGGVAVCEDYIELRQQTDTPELKSQGVIVGADSGINSVLTMSDGQASTKDVHGHDLSSIIAKLSRKTKGSKSFKQAQQHRKNYINWSVNQLNLENIKQINLEKINTFSRVGKSRQLSHFAHSFISEKLSRMCEESGVQISEQSSTYKSQRCSGCGLVRKANRRGKIYSCKECGIQIDSDLNSAINNSLDLPTVPFALRQQGINLKGFWWQHNGFWDLAGQELVVPDAQ